MADADKSDVPYQVFSLPEVDRQRGDERWMEFHRSATQYAGIYVLPRGADDDQTPHDDDEIYYVLSGRGRIALGTGGESQAVSTGSIIYVKSQEEHRFVEIEEDLHLLVFFSLSGDTATPNTPADS